MHKPLLSSKQIRHIEALYSPKEIGNYKRVHKFGCGLFAFLAQYQLLRGKYIPLYFIYVLMVVKKAH